jgi:hypothetical protein
VKCCVPLHYLKREKREEKRRKFYIYPDVTHTHIYIYPPTPADARGSAPGNKTFDLGFGLLPLLFNSIG